MRNRTTRSQQLARRAGRYIPSPEAAQPKNMPATAQPGDSPAAAPSSALPASSLPQEPSPQPQKARRAKPVRLKAKRKRLGFCMRLLGGLTAIAVCALLFVALMMDNSHFDTTVYQLDGTGLTHPIRVAVLADLHQNVYGENNDELFRQIAAMKPDMICVVGDMLNKKTPDWAFMTDFLTRLRELGPVWYSLGNHEVHERLMNGVDVCQRIADCGVTALNNQLEVVEVNGNRIVIGGLTQSRQDIALYSRGFVDTFANESPELYHILLSHYPENFDGYIENQISGLALAGHTEGGLARIPVLGALYAPDQGFLPKLTEGTHTFDNATLVISRGLGGHSVIPRINNRPELVFVDLRP